MEARRKPPCWGSTILTLPHSIYIYSMFVLTYNSACVSFGGYAGRSQARLCAEEVRARAPEPQNQAAETRKLRSMWSPKTPGIGGGSFCWGTSLVSVPWQSTEEWEDIAGLPAICSAAANALHFDCGSVNGLTK